MKILGIFLSLIVLISIGSTEQSSFINTFRMDRLILQFERGLTHSQKLSYLVERNLLVVERHDDRLDRIVVIVDVYHYHDGDVYTNDSIRQALIEASNDFTEDPRIAYASPMVKMEN